MSNGKIVLDNNFLVEGTDSQITQLFGYDNQEVYAEQLNFFTPNFDQTKHLINPKYLNIE